jgi:ParB-like chromosome segregation protein Spo0J
MTKKTTTPTPEAANAPAAETATLETPAAQAPAQEYEIHPLAGLLPMMSERESMLLRADIFKNGQQEEIILLDDMILDGRNRYKACRDLGIPPKTKPFEGDTSAALEFVIARNIHRRQLSASQKSIVALNCLPHIRDVVARERIEKIRAARKEIQAMLPGTTRKTASNLQSRDIAGMLVGVSGRSVQYAEELSAKAPEMVAKVMKGDIALSKALREAKVRVKRNKGRPADPIGATLKRLILLVEASKDVPRDVLEQLTEAMDALGKVRADARRVKDEAAKAAKDAKAAKKPAPAARKGKKPAKK